MVNESWYKEFQEAVKEIEDSSSKSNTYADNRRMERLVGYPGYNGLPVPVRFSPLSAGQKRMIEEIKAQEVASESGLGKRV
jgi:hypothetical protein